MSSNKLRAEALRGGRPRVDDIEYKEYMQKMGIKNTQHLIVRHHDAPHPHCHIVYNRIDNGGKTITDSNIRLRNMTACRELTKTHGLYFASGKENVNEHRLREPDKTKHEIYHAIKDGLQGSKNWNDLIYNLNRKGISVEFKYKGSTGIKEGVKFSKNGYTFSGSKIDQAFSYSKIDGHFKQLQLHQAPKCSPQALKNMKISVDSYKSAFGKCFSSSKEGSVEVNFSAFGAGTTPEALTA